MIGIIDYGMGNLGSVSNAFRYLDLDAKIVTQKQEMDACSALILPGVGGFGDCMAHLVEHDFVDAVKGWADAGRPLMGICLGLQALFEQSEEAPGVSGLGLFEGTVKRFDLPAEFKVPQIGWNCMTKVRPECPMFEGIDDESFFYLVHSYYVCPEKDELIAGRTEYGIEYCSAAWKDNIFATQFHPEKSQAVGLRMLKNFWNWAESQ